MKKILRQARSSLILSPSTTTTEDMKNCKYTEAFLKAQTIGEALKREDGTAIEGTVYLGGPQATYLIKKGEDLFIAEHGLLNVGSDGTVPWHGYMPYGKHVTVTAEALKMLAGKL